MTKPMNDHQDHIEELAQKLEALLQQQEHFAQELKALNSEIEAVKK